MPWLSTSVLTAADCARVNASSAWWKIAGSAPSKFHCRACASVSSSVSRIDCG
jgi:hypothetical protein